MGAGSRSVHRPRNLRKLIPRWLVLEWRHGIMGARRYRNGIMGTQRYVWRNANMEVGKNGRMETQEWKHGGMGTWMYGIET